MDKDTRNAIERATQEVRKLLEGDFASQLEGDFDVHRDGKVAARAGDHLSARQAFQRERIVAAIEHKRAAGMNPADAVRDYVRDAAFTTLNRFVALKMLEARELVLECITKGEMSSGYVEFCGMAPGVNLLPESAGYRLYIESLFDELSTEVKVLFDRRDPSSVLWPKRATFEQLLKELNATTLARVWGEDETIGWVYQFFNGQDERKKMRDESDAPRSSRELAVRNQFFTPRYVVQFLTDNTLGRIWYEMRGSKTLLTERCEYMVREPNESIAPRAKKDPRDLRVLDPACGSGHFLLYAFDVLLAIYEEAHTDADAPTSEATGKTLAEDYPSLDALRSAVPGLVLAHNLHGVDIDPRCAQIAQLALWMRAQKAYRDLGIARGERPHIRRSNIVVAEPLVADDQIVKEFVAKLGDAELGRVFTCLVDSLSLAGHLGLLLRVEELVRGQTGDLFAPAEQRIRTALERFVRDEVGASDTRRQLFTDDAVQGLGLLETAEKRFDVVVMNPPFGDATDASLATLKGVSSVSDLFCAFVQRGLELAPDGIVGAITNASFLLYTDFEPYRAWIQREASLRILADLGWGVLDAAVSTCMYCLTRRAPAMEETLFIDADCGETRSAALADVVSALRCERAHERVHAHLLSAFSPLAGSPLCFWLSTSVLEWIAKADCLSQFWSEHGIGAGPHNFFFRLRWELPRNEQDGKGKWPVLANGGAFSPFFRDNPLHIDWSDAGAKVKAHLNNVYPYLKGNVGIKIQREHIYLQPGLTYGKRTSRFNAQVLPAGCIPSFEGIGAYPRDEDDRWWLLAYMNSRFVAFLLNVTCGQHKNAVYVDRIPVPSFTSEQKEVLESAAKTLFESQRNACSVKETSSAFRRPALIGITGESLMLRMQRWKTQDRTLETQMWAAIAAIEREVRKSICPDESLSRLIDRDQGPDITQFARREFQGSATKLLSTSSLSGPTRPILCRGEADHTDVFRISMATGIHPESAAQFLNADGFVEEAELHLRVNELFSWVVGTLMNGDTSAGESHRLWVDDEGHAEDMPTAIQELLIQTLDDADHSQPMCAEALRLLGASSLREWLRHAFFASHVAMYTTSRRKAPIYWQLATPSAKYSVWLYIHAFS